MLTIATLGSYAKVTKKTPQYACGVRAIVSVGLVVLIGQSAVGSVVVNETTRLRAVACC